MVSEQGKEMEPNKEILESSDIEKPVYVNTYRIGSYDGKYNLDFGEWLESNRVKVLARIILEDQQIWSFITDMISSCIEYEEVTGKKIIPEEVKTQLPSEEDE